ncbi:MAG: hypothetical protein U0R19_18305 [Bryobacteraceae bacterium]
MRLLVPAAMAAVSLGVSEVRPGPVPVVTAAESAPVEWEDQALRRCTAEFSLEPAKPSLTALRVNGKLIVDRAAPLYRVETGKGCGGWELIRVETVCLRGASADQGGDGISGQDSRWMNVKMVRLPSWENYGAIGIAVTARVQHTVPLQFWEVAMGNGMRTEKAVFRLDTTREFGKEKFSWKVDAPGRMAIWDVAANGAMLNPVWRYYAPAWRLAPQLASGRTRVG